MATKLGHFLRYLHYLLSAMIRDPEEEPQLLTQLIKTAGTLMHVTPYKFMLKGLSNHLLDAICERLYEK